MSLEQKRENRLYGNPNEPRFPENTEAFNRLYADIKFSFTQGKLHEVNKKIRGYSDVLVEPLSYDRDRRVYEWFLCVVFRRKGNEIVVTYPWKTDTDQVNEVANDRSIAYYANKDVPDDALEDLSDDLVKAIKEFKESGI